MPTRTPRVFVASTLVGLEKEREALELLICKYRDKVDFWGYPWIGGGDPGAESQKKSRESDFLFLIIGGRYGTKDPRMGIGITQLEYEEFLYSHSSEYVTDNDPKPLYIFEKDPSVIEPHEADLPPDSKMREEFHARLKKRHVVPKFKNWTDLAELVNNVLELIPDKVPDKNYKKLSIHDFDFKILGLGSYREDQIESRWVSCPCSVFQSGNCDFNEPLYYLPPPELETEMKRHLEELWDDPETDVRWRDDQPSFKTIRIMESTIQPKLCFEFCHSTWHNFLGTNQGASKDKSIMQFLINSKYGYDLTRSPFSNNLGMSIAVIDTKEERIFWTVRKQVSIHPGLRSTAVGTQLHAYDSNHVNADGVPKIFAAARNELLNDAKLFPDDIRDLYIGAWGVGTRTGTPELLFICDSVKPLSQISDDICKAHVKHAAEFDRVQMRMNVLIKHDYELLADIYKYPDLWEPEAAVACCLALNVISPNCISFE